MTKSPTFSIVIPIYNIEKILPMFENLMSSILEQSWTDYEVICVNDVSTDNSIQILTQYVERDNRIRLHCMAQNSGQGLSRNAGTQLAQGQYVFCVDQDDALAHGALAYLQKIIIEQDSPDIISFSCQIFEIEQTEKFYRDQSQAGLLKVDECLATSGQCFTGSAILEYHLETMHVCVWTRITKREIAQKVLFPSYLPEDYLHSLKTYALARSLYVSEAKCYTHFSHKNSCAASSERLKLFHEYLTAYPDIQNFLITLEQMIYNARLIKNYHLWFIWVTCWWLLKAKFVSRDNYQEWRTVLKSACFSPVDHWRFIVWRRRRGELKPLIKIFLKTVAVEVNL